MARYAIAIDVEKCTGCHSCFLACKDEFAGNDHLPHSAAQPEHGQEWLRLEEIEHGGGTKVKLDYLPILCQHCRQAPCMADDSRAVYRRADGIVIIDPVKAKGRKDLAASCPYGVIRWNEAVGLPQKCTLCAHLLDSGEKTTRCVECCPTGAMVFGDVDDPNSAISQRLAAGRTEDYRPQFGTEPALKYVGIPRPFLAGEVLLGDRRGECAPGVRVTLRAKNSDKLRETTTDFLGDFEFKNLEKDTDYVVKAEVAGYLPREVEVRISASRNLGEVILVTR